MGFGGGPHIESLYEVPKQHKRPAPLMDLKNSFGPASYLFRFLAFQHPYPVLIRKPIETNQTQSDWRTPCDVPKLTIIEMQNPFTKIENMSGEGHHDSGFNKEHEGVERSSLRG